jgi:hypothetical protein
LNLGSLLVKVKVVVRDFGVALLAFLVRGLRPAGGLIQILHATHRKGLARP